MTLSTRIGVMDAGRIIQVGEPSEIYEYPASRFVADFIGSVNIFEGRVVEDEPDYVRIASEEAGTDLHVGHGVTCTIDQQVWYAIRPEKIRISRERPEDTPNLLRGMVDEVLYFGDQSTYRIRLDNGRKVKASKPNLLRHDEDAISWDEPVWLSWDDTAGVVLTQ